MLNWNDLSRLLMIFIGALSGFGSARDMKAGTLAIILFVLGGLLLGIGMSAASFELERRLNKLPVRLRLSVSFLISLVGLLAAYFTPVLLALIIYRHR